MIRLVRKAVSGCVPSMLVLLGLSGSALMGQVQVIGQWSTMSQTMPINPIHVTLRERLAANAAILTRLAEIDKTLILQDSALHDIYSRLLPLLAPQPDPPK